jgi:hypothetical protein
MPALEGVKDQLSTKQFPLPEMQVAEPGRLGHEERLGLSRGLGLDQCISELSLCLSVTPTQGSAPSADLAPLAYSLPGVSVAGAALKLSLSLPRLAST